MKPKSLAIFLSNDVLPTNADGSMPFRQNNDLFYLSGIDQEETILLLFPDAPDNNHKEILFVRETNEHIAVWEGEKLNKDEAKKISGIQNVLWADQFESMLRVIALEADNIYLNTNEHARSDNTITTRQERFIPICREKFPLHHYERSAPLMHQLRSIKSPFEIELIKNACNITEKAFRRVLKFIKPGVKEYEIEAEILHEFVRNQSRGPAYQSIVASGKSACILHYIENSRECRDGDLLLMDFGAEYANYAADLTRTVPVNGKFNPRQKAVYNAVLKVMKEAKNMLRPGITLAQYNQEVGKIMESELIGLGLLKKEDIQKQDKNAPLYKKYFMHGTSHFLGLDVHDVGNRFEPIKKGMVFTCEPGIYIREEGIGIRIENDILVTDTEPVDLMAGIPIEIEEIEHLMSNNQ